ncbi:MAG: GxxExxY protein [Rhodospirillaceae bacterium]|jgi:GxxExxY protein|nr:GxxExxY protein [Rhodospirillaceae bacterium]MBT4589461.1 GxxExxY protein [Rhodospirillaceae bacterium]MBT7267078.1 GxxExxY protein [Rhodospirillaceae bacterium]
MGSDRLTDRVIGLAIEVHKSLGPGLLESAYENCLSYELDSFGLTFTKQKSIPIKYKNVQLNCGFRADVIVEDQLLLELKAIGKILPLHEAQLLTYLKLTGLKTGLILNFNTVLLKDGIRRMVL